ncbi:MAG: molecular chaperone TorD family protein [Dissulfurispiraceae bacterium]|jgi:DMSO reductase family type II enzyme chaperone|nr:molecular chaperone TorD family protein [Dissulfurispiraceae bacterium]
MNTEISNILARSFIYKLLAVGFSYPTPEFFNELKNGAFWMSMKENVKQLSSEVLNKIILDIEDGISLSDVPFDNLESEYINAFEIDKPTPSTSLYEGSYDSEVNRGVLLLELQGFYKNFGLDISKSFKELEDCITVELEFMHFLTLKEAQAKEDNIDPIPYQKAGKDFLERHLGRWISKFRVDVESKVKLSFFRSLAILTDEFIASEIKRIQSI